MRGGFAHRLGFVPKERERSAWFIGDSELAFDAVTPLLAELMRVQPRLRIILSGKNAAQRSTLQEKFPDCLVWPMPFDNGFSIGEYLVRGNIRAAIVLENAASVTPGLIAGLKRRAIGLVALCARDDAHASVPRVASACEIVMQIGGSSSRKNPGSEKSGVQNLSINAGAQLLGEMLGRDLKAMRDAGESADWFWRAIVNNSDGVLLARRLRRYSTPTELRHALGNPETILCLGNGPSSEDATLQEMTHDVLFRVNHSWAVRGFLTRPDVVFTGGRPSIRVVRGAVFGLQNAGGARRLVAVRMFNPLRGLTRFFEVGDINPLVHDFPWGALRPTNGATMLAAAVALEPRRLIVAGIDMFQHPDGSYPGDNSTPNAFSPAHTSEAELAFVLALFDHFDGELVIIGDVLQKAWRKHLAARVRPDTRAAKQRR